MTDHSVTPHEHWDALAAGYALHALEPDEELAFAEHLAGCAECSDRLREHELVAAQLGSIADDGEDVAPPSWASLRTGIVGAQAAAPAAPVVPLQRRRRPGRVGRALMAAAAAVVVAGIAVVGWQATHGSATAAARAAAACEREAGCSVVRLHVAHGSDAAFVLVRGDRVTLAPLALARPAADRMYVLWQLPRNGRPIPVGGFRSTSSPVSASLPTSYAATAAFAVSLEPAGPMPTQPSHVLAVGPTT